MREPSTPTMFLIAITLIALGAIAAEHFIPDDVVEEVVEEPPTQPAIIRF